MNYYEQFYDDLEFEEEEDTYHRGNNREKSRNQGEQSCDPREDSLDARDHRKESWDPPKDSWDSSDTKEKSLDSKNDSWDARDYQEDWSHRDEQYKQGGHNRGHQSRDVDTDYDRDDMEGWENNAGRGFLGRARGQWHRGRGERGRGNWGERGRGFGDRGRGFGDRGRGFGGRGRGFRDEGRGRFGRGRQRGRGRGIPQMNFVKATDTATTEAKTEPNNEKPSDTESAVNIQPMPVLSSYGYGPGSGFEEFGATVPPGVAQSETPGPGVPGEEVPVMGPPQVPGAAQSTSATTTTTSPSQPAHKVVTAIVKPMYNFVKAGSEFKSTDVAFHMTGPPVKPANPAFFPPSQDQKHAGLGMAGPKAQLQTFDVATAFNARARQDGCNPVFDAKFNRLCEAVKACSLPMKNSIEVIHMATDKVKMKITDINKPGGRSPSGQMMFSCRLEIDGVFVAEGCAGNKKAAKHLAYEKGKTVFEGGIVTVKKVSESLFELKIKDPPVPQAGPVQPTFTPSPGGKPNPAAAKAGTLAANTSYKKPQIVFHNTSHPDADKPLTFAGPSQQSGPKSSASAGELAMKLLNFVKEGSGVPTTQSAGTSSANTSQSSSFNKPAQKSQASIRTPNKNMLKRALDSVTSSNVRAKKAKGPLSLEDLSQFVIIDNSPLYPSISDICILHASANHNKVVLKFEYELCEEGYNCSMVLGVHMVASAMGKSKEEAKIAAAKEALSHLREICYTVVVKQDVDSDADGMTKTEMVKGDKSNQMIADSNVGNMLLRKMGWAGGGVGKDGQGIAEPVKTEMVIGRAGLGLKAEQGVGKDFNKHVTKMLNEYITSDDQRDLHFSSELAKEERAVIHQIGQKLGLKTQSKGKGEDRYLIVSRKRSANQLLEHIMSSGGSTSKYEVVPPSNPDVDPRKREAITYGHGKQ